MRRKQRQSTVSHDYERVEQAVRFIEQNFRSQPSLREVAGAVGLSDYHFQRLFKRWVGISPKRFLQFLTVGHAKGLLRNGKSVLQTSYDAGLSGPSRLHDLFVSVDAVTPGEFKAQGRGLAISFGFHETPFGQCFIAATERGVTNLEFGGGRGAVTRLGRTWSAAKLKQDRRLTGRLVQQIFASDRDSPASITLYLKGTNFQLKVWQALLEIPSGHVASYQDVARAIDSPGAERAVGNAVGSNPVAFVIPCHRVIRKSGAFGDYRWGRVRKKAILGWEAARLVG
ncbi:MAG: methylated-DNA--[protein]-cysteine S-methyltransferase [Gemmatimonadota bacterium]|nr:MAG: methylated-DNA--[protein]-cysteine S-methyltransferase [Gemmatimonadota bacterium]